MEAFLHQQLHPSLFDEMSFLPHQNGELSASSCFTNVYNLSQETSTLSSLEDVMPPHKPQVLSLEKKRKQRDNDESCLTTGQLEGAKESRSRRKKSNGPSEGSKDEKKPKAKEIKATNKEEPPSGYIHVRARRGQATDSHSLAERVRRERISERMKKLQSLVPGCDKVIGKALVLDEIINYVQSLQNQVEFLSMKIASVNSTYGICVDFEDSLRRPEEMRSLSEQTPSRVQNSHFPLTTFEGAANNIQVIDPSSSAFPLHGHLGSTAFSQDRSNFLMQVDDNRMELLNQLELHNMFCML